jgi:hypothetical protein
VWEKFIIHQVKIFIQGYKACKTTNYITLHRI